MRATAWTWARIVACSALGALFLVGAFGPRDWSVQTLALTAGAILIAILVAGWATARRGTGALEERRDRRP